MKNLVLNIPHSSLHGIFDEKIGKWRLNSFLINDVVIPHTDIFTDLVFRVKDMENITPIVFPYSRFVCDVERLENDPLEEIGQGIIYTKFKGYTRQPLTDEEKQAILQLRIEHINKLKSALNKDSILIDCHSFIAEEDDRWIDVCIGFNNDWSYNKKVVDIVYKTFKKHGYEVSLNKPYANSIAPKMDFEYPSVMIEANKALYYNYYLNILNTDPKVWMRWYYCLGEVYQNLKSI